MDLYARIVVRSECKTGEGTLEDRVNEISLHISIRAITLLRDSRLNIEDARGLKAPISMFPSHAKADLSKDEKDSVTWVMNGLGKLPVEGRNDIGRPQAQSPGRIERLC
ncbi:MAG TPA: hypothetical protein DD473_07660 [Planctomycetaceae bacterium]|nr:hypothetical protein [Planctomycetaceae bacterium]